VPELSGVCYSWFGPVAVNGDECEFPKSDRVHSQWIILLFCRVVVLFSETYNKHCHILD
jgi:hypothetical protein